MLPVFGRKDADTIMSLMSLLRGSHEAVLPGKWIKKHLQYCLSELPLLKKKKYIHKDQAGEHTKKTVFKYQRILSNVLTAYESVFSEWTMPFQFDNTTQRRLRAYCCMKSASRRNDTL